MPRGGSSGAGITCAVNHYEHRLSVALAQRFVANLDSALEDQFLYDSKAEVEAIHEPQGVVDHSRRETIPSVTIWVGPVTGYQLERTSPG
jgi:hypothetical protein